MGIIRSSKLENPDCLRGELLGSIWPENHIQLASQPDMAWKPTTTRLLAWR